MTTAASVARHARAKRLFLAACDRSLEERPAFLADACGDDSELCREVETLLAHHHQPAATDSTVSSSRPPEIAGFRLVQKLGEGGMGEVWEAEQERPVRRRVALKVIKCGMDTREVVARFESERQALALMDHPAVARVFEAGATAEGRPWFAMELVRGVSITDYCDTQRLAVCERLRLFLPVCDGVQHAHHKGIIHRDLKPTNVLVAVRDGRPVPKIIDFGVARATAQRLTERTIFTKLGQWIGTPEYMSPEQAEMNGLDIDTRTDVYSLGVVLYELLTGTQPLDSEELRRAGFDEMRRRIRHEEPPRPSARINTLGKGASQAMMRRRGDGPALARDLCGDLDWITMKALEKDRTRRYGSPAELAADLERHLSDLPVTAGPPATLYRAGKFVRRHRLAVATAAAILLALVLGLTLALFGLGRARQAEGLARQEAEAARQASGVLANILEDLAWSELEGDELGTARRYAERSLEIRREAFGESDSRTASSLALMAIVRAQSGDLAGAREQLARARATIDQAWGPTHPEALIHLYNHACLAALDGARADALGHLRELVVNRGWADAWLFEDPDFTSFHDDPEFEAIATEVRRRLDERTPDP